MSGIAREGEQREATQERNDLREKRGGQSKGVFSLCLRPSLRENEKKQREALI